MPFQAYNKLLIADQPLVNTRIENAVIGYEFKLQYPSYRGTFLSCIEELTFQMDGEPIDKSKITFILNGKEFLIDELSECFKEYWFALDYAIVRVLKPGGLSSGPHELTAYIKHRIPYTGYFGEYMVLDTTQHRVWEVKEG